MRRESLEPKIRKQTVEIGLTRPNPETGEQEVYDTIGLVAVDYNPEEVGPEEAAELERVAAENNAKLAAQRERKYTEWLERGDDPDDPAFQQWKAALAR